ncbi:hypothetical protein HanLR1_Chr12g0454681 [Helianthus annuus]|nr:hypothetical protein HanHA89_Chr12g0477791 [Helianthus annuus]KAJ0675742.1 hypothetical protein HanLR1_Chr12g0454681 [Helianthus annuus]
MFRSNPVDSVNPRVNSAQHRIDSVNVVNVSTRDWNVIECSLANSRSWNDITESH